MEVNNQSSGALEVDNSRTDDEEIDDEETEEEIDDDDDADSDTTPPPIRKHSATSQIETLAVPSCYLHSEVPGEYTTLRRPGPAKLKNQVQGSHQEALASVIAQAAQPNSQNQLQLSGCSPSLESSPISTIQPISSFRSPTLQVERLAPDANNNSKCMTILDKKNASDSTSVSTLPIVRKLRADGYNWRKYGQKQVKSPLGSRSYYKCTCTQCYAKKIECSDHSNCVTDIIYKGQHNHEPPKKVNRSRESKLAIPVLPVDDKKDTSEPIQALVDTGPSTCSKEVLPETPTIVEMKRNDSINSNGGAKFKVREEHANEPAPKQRLKKNGSAYSGALLKPGKKPKLVVHAAADVGISGDGYRWRKYGQKMVKGNPHPRNYYRCTSAGCPVRKHIETAVNSSTGVIITYKGGHDHDMPVPKKRHGAPSGLLVAPAAAMNNLQSTRTEALSNQVSATQLSVNAEGGSKGEEALNVKEEKKAVDSTRTLLSIDFEITPC